MLFGNCGVEADRLGGIFVENGIEEGAGGVSDERKKTSRHFIEDDSEGDQVGTRVERLDQDLFGRHVRNRAKGAAGTSELHGIDGQRG